MQLIRYLIARWRWHSGRSRMPAHHYYASRWKSWRLLILLRDLQDSKLSRTAAWRKFHHKFSVSSDTI
jgi:hypothetical protein